MMWYVREEGFLVLSCTYCIDQEKQEKPNIPQETSQETQ
jgi:hypothetical protein